jgi:hypothetical protein
MIWVRGQLRHRQVRQDRFRHCLLRLLLDLFTQAVAVLVAGLLHCRRQVLQQMPVIGHLQGVRGGPLDRLGVGAGPVPADDLRTGMLCEPGHERLRGAVGQHVHDASGLGVDEHGVVGAALAEGELVHPQHPWCTVRHCWRRQQFEQAGPACGQPQAVAQSRSRTAAEFHRDRPQPTRQPDARAAVPLGQPADLLNERLSRATRAVAEEPPNPEPDYHPARA